MGKKIYLSNYCHADHVWTNTREWHVARYLRSINTALDVIKEHPDFVYVVDNYCHFLQPFFDNYKERENELKTALKNGNIVFLNGGYSLPRPTRRGEEEFLRNVVKGKRVLEEISGIPIKTFFNADTAFGHAQLPQILKLSGHENYICWRPELALNNKKVPKRFTWKGIDGSPVSVCRVIYSSYFTDNYLGENYDFEKAKEGLDKEIEERAFLLDGDKILMFEGIDDCIPLMGALDTNAPAFDFIKEYNSKTENEINYASPDDFFRDSNENLKTVDGVVEQTDVAFNLPTKMPEHSLYRKRIEIIYALLKLERLSAICEKFASIRTPSEKFERLWDIVYLISGHAEDNAIDTEIVYLLNRVNQGLFEIEEETLRLKSEFAKRVKGDDRDYIVFNYGGVSKKVNVKVHIADYNGIHDFTLKDSKGNLLDYQVTRVYKNDKPYKSFNYSAMDIVVNMNVPGMGYERISVIFDESKDIKLNVPLSTVFGIADGEKIEDSIEIDNGVFKIKFNGRGVESVTSYDGKKFEGDMGSICFERTDTPKSWWSNMPTKNSFSQENYECRMIAKGDLINKFEIKGVVDKHAVRQVITIEKDKPTVDILTEINCLDDCGRFWAKFSSDGSPKMRVGIPFGEEDRDLSLEAYEGIEQNLKGLFYYGDYITAKNNGNKFTIFNGNLCNGAKLEEDGVYLFLRRSFGSSYRNDTNEIAWFNQCDKFNKANGVMSFEYSICPFDTDQNLSRLAKENLIKPDATKKYNLSGDVDAFGDMLDIKTQNVTLSSFRKVDDGYELRVFESKNEQSELKIVSDFEEILSVDLNGNSMDDDSDKISPYQIKTLICK